MSKPEPYYFLLNIGMFSTENIRRKRMLDGTFVYRRNRHLLPDQLPLNITDPNQIFKYWLNIVVNK